MLARQTVLLTSQQFSGALFNSSGDVGRTIGQRHSSIVLMNRKYSFLFIVLVAINIAAAGVDVWARTEIFRASPLAPGHLIAATNALTRDGVRDILLGRRCHVI